MQFGSRVRNYLCETVLLQKLKVNQLVKE